MQMRKKHLYYLMVLLLLPACAGRQQQVAVGPEAGENVVAMSASSFEFEPNNIRAREGDEVVFRITNTSGTGHNFTIRDPQGNILQSVELPEKKTVDVRIRFAESGMYDFYCDKPFHPTLGMKGRVEVVS